MRKILAFLLILSMLAAFAGCNKPVTPAATEAGKADKTENASAGETPVSETPEPTVCPGTYTELAIYSKEKSSWLFPFGHVGSLFDVLLSAEENGIMAELLKVRADEEIGLILPNAYDTCGLSEVLVYLDQGCVTEYRFDTFEKALEYAREHIDFKPVVDVILKQDGEEVGYAFILESGTASLPSTVPDPPAENQYLWLVDGGETVLPYKEFDYGASYVEPNEDNPNGCMLSADGRAFFEGILGSAGSFPAVNRGYDTVIYADCAVKSITVFDAVTRERLADGVNMSELPAVIEANGQALIVQIVVCHTGDYIEAIGENEEDAYMFGYFVKSDGNERPLLSRMTEEELEVALIGLGVDMPEEPPFSITYLAALFEEDIEAPYPSDIYFDAAHNFFEEVRRAVSIYYGCE